MHVGNNWQLLDGNDSGETFYDSSAHLQDLSVFEHPINVHYSCKSVTGWPRIYVEVWGVDEYGRHTIYGYGVVSVPCSPGNYNLEIPMWRPEGTTFQKFASLFLGANPELSYTNVVLSANDRFGMQCVSTGSVQVRLGVVTKDFNLHGVCIN